MSTSDYDLKDMVIKNSIISGNQGEYFKCNYYIDYEDGDAYQDCYTSSINVSFGYLDCIWSIRLFWHYYTEDEPPEIERYFNHMIETFKFLE